MSSSEGGFPWGLTPGGGGEPSEPSETDAQPPVAPDPAPPLTPPPALTPPPPSPPPAAAAPTPVAPTPADPPPAAPTSPDPEMPTQAMPVFEPLAIERPAVEPLTEAYPAPLDPALDGVADALAPHHVGHEDPVDEGLEASAIESLFGEEAFIEYGEQPLIPPRDSPPPAAHPGAELVAVPIAARPSPGQLGRTQKILLWVAGGLLAALALVAFFLLGTRMAPSPVIVASPSPSPSAGPVVGPVPPGEYAWNALLGGECLEPFESAWQTTYVVVDCGAPHAGQLVDRGTLDDPAATPYPGVEALQARVVPLCSAPTVIDYAAAASMVDIEISASFAPDAAMWDAGQRDYFCFVHRTGAEPFTTSLAQPQVEPTPAP